MANIEGKTKRKSVKLRDCVHKIVRILLLRVCSMCVCLRYLYEQQLKMNQPMRMHGMKAENVVSIVNIYAHRTWLFFIFFFFSFLMT